MKTLNKLSDFVSANLTLIVLAVTALSFFVPASFLWAAPRTTMLLSAVMFGMGMTLNFSDFKQAFSNPRHVLTGCTLQYAVMPVLAFLLAKAFALPPELAVGVVLVGATPGGTASNVMTYLAKGDVALSVSMTMVSTLLAPVLTPAFTWMLAGQWVEVSLLAMVKSVVRVVLVPIALGLVTQKFLSKYLEGVSKLMVLVSAFSVLSIMGAMMGANKAHIVQSGLLLAVVLVLHNLGGYALGYLVASKLGLDRKRCATVSIEVGMQNAALACNLANSHFTVLAGVPGAVAGVVHQITGSMLASYFARSSTTEEKQTSEAVKLAEVL